MKGKRAINSDHYSSCEVEHWVLIDPDSVYTDKSKKKHKGSELISKRRISIKNWDMEAFH